MKPDIKGLTKLARTINRLPRKNFYMGAWLKDSEESSCGTTGCIAGWAALTFPHRFKKEDWGDGYYDVVHRTTGLRNEEGFAAGFRISHDEAENLTLKNINRKSTPKSAAKAVMSLVGKLKKALKK